MALAAHKRFRENGDRVS